LGAVADGLGVWLRVVSPDEVPKEVVIGARIPVAGWLKESPTSAKAATETAMAKGTPASPSPMIVSVRFMLGLALTPG
jgi:hypothetical protein